MTKYILHIIGDIKPLICGPYTSENKRIENARALRNKDPEMRNGIYRLDITQRATDNFEHGGQSAIIIASQVTVSTFSNGELEE